MATVDIDNIERRAAVFFDEGKPVIGYGELTRLIADFRQLEKRNSFIEDAYKAQTPHFKDWLDKQSYGHSVKDAWIQELQKIVLELSGNTYAPEKLLLDPTSESGIQDAAEVLRSERSFT